MHRTLDELPEPLLQQVIDYVVAAGSLTRGKHDFRIPYIVAHEWALTGRCVLSTNDLARRFKSTRRTMCNAIDRLIEAGAIRIVGRTADNRAMYEPCLETGEIWRAEREASFEEWKASHGGRNGC